MVVFCSPLQKIYKLICHSISNRKQAKGAHWVKKQGGLVLPEQIR
jgi:hypothetical protein